jgi:hypothetical protein
VQDFAGMTKALNGRLGFAPIVEAYSATYAAGEL